MAQLRAKLRRCPLSPCSQSQSNCVGERLGRSCCCRTRIRERAALDAHWRRGCSLTNAIPADVWNSLRQDQKHFVAIDCRRCKVFPGEPSFEVAHFDRQFRSLEERLSKTGEVISRLPRIDNDNPGKVNFTILYTRKAETNQIVSELPIFRSHSPKITYCRLATSYRRIPDLRIRLRESFQKFSAELANCR